MLEEMKIKYTAALVFWLRLTWYGTTITESIHPTAKSVQFVCLLIGS